MTARTHGRTRTGFRRDGNSSHPQRLVTIPLANHYQVYATLAAIAASMERPRPIATGGK
jgi:hypothetical protein